jgi:quinol monooxygenase YgiN
MRVSLRQFLTMTSIFLLSVVPAFAGDSDGKNPSPVRGPIFDITHFDVIPLTENGVDFEQAAYTALFEYRDASKSDPGFESFRVVNWLLASNHSQIIDVWHSLDAFEAHLAQPHSVAFRFAVQVQPSPPPPGFNCCIGSPIDDRQYGQVISLPDYA